MNNMNQSIYTNKESLTDLDLSFLELIEHEIALWDDEDIFLNS
jgi:hypothetical protein